MTQYPEGPADQESLSVASGGLVHRLRRDRRFQPGRRGPVASLIAGEGWASTRKRSNIGTLIPTVCETASADELSGCNGRARARSLNF